MSSESVVCPHCGTRRTDVKPGVAGKLAQEEIRALLVTDAALRGSVTSEGLFATLVLPHPSTRGVARGIEIGLTIACFPIIALASIGVLVKRRASDRRKARETEGEAAPVVAMLLLGAPLLLSVLGLTMTGFVLTIGGVIGLGVRAAIRSHAATAANRELTRLP